MKHDLMDILMCPLCKQSLELEVELEEKGEIIKGTLRCHQCLQNYPIEGSVPNLLPPDLRA